MVALATTGAFSNPASLLARYAGAFGAGRADAARGAGGSLPARRDEAAPALNGSGPAVMAQISDAARSLFAQMRQQGAQSASYELHLDLEQLGVSVDGRGNRSIEGRSLSVDLHIEAQQGVMQTAQGEVQFERLHVEFEMTETRVIARESADSAVGSSLEEGLASLGALLSEATRGSDKTSFGLADLMDVLGDQVDRLQSLLAQIGQALEAQAGAGAPGEPSAGRAHPRANAYMESMQLSLEVQLTSLLFTRTAPVEPEAEGATPALESTAAV